MDPEDVSISEPTSIEYELLTPIGYSNSSKCGYCGARGKSFSYYANATSLSSPFYQTLLDRSWRRSGKLLYRPNQRKSCCPHYTIRLDSTQFHPSRDQRQAINRFNKYVLGDTYIKDASRLYPRSREETKKRDNEFHLTERIHEAEYKNLKLPPEPAHKFEVTLESDEFTEEKYNVYNNYQIVVHGDAPEERSPQSFQRFLCSSPLKPTSMTGPDGKKRLLGSFHQCYRLDGKLVAIGVLDLLPQCVSSVYFLYHESIHKFAPGKLGALHEISLAIEGGYQYWYPGFYIHSCPKMRYKIDYMPQYILDPENLDWSIIDQKVLNILDKRPYVSLSSRHEDKQEKLEHTIVMGLSANADLPQNDSTEVSEGVSETISAAQSIAGQARDDTYADDEEDDFYRSLFRARMPGIPSIPYMESLDLDHIILKIFPNGPLFETCDLVNWKSSKISDSQGIKPTIAELIAALGADLIGLICLDLDEDYATLGCLSF